jgi:hypothetical protein
LALVEKYQRSNVDLTLNLNVHPQRWNDKFVPWFIELVSQNVKNVVKRAIARRRERRRSEAIRVKAQSSRLKG